MSKIYTLDDIRLSGNLQGYIDPEQFPDGSFMAEYYLDIAETIDNPCQYLRFLSPSGEIVIDNIECTKGQNDAINCLIKALRLGEIILETFKVEQMEEWFQIQKKKKRSRKIRTNEYPFD